MLMSSDKHRHRRRGKHRRPDAEPANSVGERDGLEAFHDDDGCTDPEREQHLVDAGPERQRDGHEVRHRRLRSSGRLRPQAADHAVEQREHARVAQQHRLGRSGRARRELDQRDVAVVNARRVRRLPSVVTDERGRTNNLDDPVDLGSVSAVG